MANISIDLDIDDELYKKIEREFQSGNYSSAIKTSILYLTECIRDRTDLDLDGDKLITKAFSLKKPLIKINNLTTNTEKDEQQGHMLLLQGIYKGIRNPRNHNLHEDSIDDFYNLIATVNYCVKLIKKSKKSFDAEHFLHIVNDPYFVSTQEYSKEIINIIPKEKLQDLSIYLYKNINATNYLNIGFVLNELIKELSSEDFVQFSKLCSNQLMSTNDHNKIKAIIYTFKDHWEEIEKLACLRIENLLIESLNAIGIDYEQDYENGSYINVYFINEHGELAKYIKFLPKDLTRVNANYQIQSLLKKKLSSDQPIVEFLIENFNKYIFKDHTRINSQYNSCFIDLLNRDEEYIYEMLTSTTEFHEELEPNYEFDTEIKEALEKYSERNINTI